MVLLFEARSDLANAGRIDRRLHARHIAVHGVTPHRGCRLVARQAVSLEAVQTFLPYPDFRRSAAVLDTARLGKQRVESLQVLRALELPNYGWATHPAVGMWRGHTPALVVYGSSCVAEWRKRGHADSTLDNIREFAPQARDWDQEELRRRGLLPSWFGDERLHRSHRSALLRKDPGHYRPCFPDVPDDLAYWWPPAEPAPRTAPCIDGSRLWVVRPSSPVTLGAFLELGRVGLDASCGIDVDANGRDLAGLRQLLAERAPRRRTGKDLRQLDAFINDIEIGDSVAIPIEGGDALLVGEVTGPYIFNGELGACHQRPVRWHARLLRSAVDPPAALQNPKTLFAVRRANDT
jgi:hypothetical protein